MHGLKFTVEFVLAKLCILIGIAWRIEASMIIDRNSAFNHCLEMADLSKFCFLV